MIRSVPHAMMQEMSEGNFLRWPKRGLDDCKCILGMQMRYRYSDNSLPMVTVKYAWEYFGECYWMLCCDTRSVRGAATARCHPMSSDNLCQVVSRQGIRFTCVY